MKKIILSFALVAALLLVGCGTGNSKDGEAKKPTGTETKDTKKKVVTVTTSFLNDMAKQLAGDFVEVKLIIPAGEDPHLYLPKPNDLEKIKSADLVLYHGLHFEGKMIDVLEKKGVAVAKNFAKEDIGTMDEDGKQISDPHFWFNIKLYKQATEVATEELMKLLPDKKDDIKKKADAYQKELDDLKVANTKALNEIPKERRFLITPHDAFNYFSREYDIQVHAPQGVSTDSEVATSDINETVDFIVKNKVKAVFAESTTDPARMEKLKEAVAKKGFDVKVVKGEGQELFSDSLAPEGSEGDTFIGMYKHNVKLIVDNLK